LTQEEYKQEKLEHLVNNISNHSDGLTQGTNLKNELHESGILEMIISSIC
jgi:hypothetical protein